MRKVIDNLKGSYGSSAKVVDGTLILSLPDAITPSVWRLDLGSVKASALEVRNRDDGTFLLVLSTPKGDVHDIAGFENKSQAIAALLSVTRALEQAHGQIKPATFAANNDNRTGGRSNAVPALYKKPPQSSESRWLAGLLGIAVLGLLVFGLINAGPKTVSSGGNGAVSGTFDESAPHDHDTGVPLSADDFLRNR